MQSRAHTSATPLTIGSPGPIFRQPPPPPNTLGSIGWYCKQLDPSFLLDWALSLYCLTDVLGMSSSTRTCSLIVTSNINVTCIYVHR
jgi:hypothetical protein